MSIKKITILYIEDDEADVEFLQSAINDVYRDAVEICVAEDGEKAVNFIEGRSEPTRRPPPHLILLDLNLPRIGGKEVLRRLKSSDDYKSIPTVIFTTSAVQEDVEHAYTLGASGFITKPSNYEGYKVTARRFCEYWLRTCRVPESAH